MYKICLRLSVERKDDSTEREVKKWKLDCSARANTVRTRKRENKTDCCTLLSVMIAFLPYLGYAKYKNYKV